MKIMDRYIWIGQIGGVIFFILGFALVGKWLIFPVILALFTLFISSWIFNWKWVSPLSLGCSCILAGFGCYKGVHPIWMLAGLSAILAAWDLQHFTWEMMDFSRVENRASLEQVHLNRLGICLGLGGVLSVVSLQFQFHLTFGITILLGFVAIFGLSRVIHHVRTMGS